MDHKHAIPPSGAVVPLRTEGSKTPLFLVHGVDGDIDRFEALARRLEAGHPVYGIRSQAFLKQPRALTRVEDMAAYYLAELRRVQERGPYSFVGFSFGGLVAFEMAQQLYARGERMRALVLLDHRRMGSLSVAPKTPATGGEPDPRPPVANSHFRNLMAPGGIRYASEKFRARSFRTAYTVLDRLGLPIPPILQRPYDINWFAGVRYVPVCYPGRLILFKSVQTIQNTGSKSGGWEQLAAEGVEVHQIEGDHEGVLYEPFVGNLARELNLCL